MKPPGGRWGDGGARSVGDGGKAHFALEPLEVQCVSEVDAAKAESVAQPAKDRADRPTRVELVRRVSRNCLRGGFHD